MPCKRHTLSAVAAFTLVLAITSGPVSAQTNTRPPEDQQGGTASSTNLGSKQKPVPCDCTNCSAEHCQPKPRSGFSGWSSGQQLQN